MPRKTSVDWSQVDWSQTNMDIARQVGLNQSTVRERRDRLGIPQHRRGDPHRHPRKKYICRWCRRTYTRADRENASKGYCCPDHGLLALAAARKARWRERSFAEEMALRSPRCRMDESNKAASEWSLAAPDGTRHRFRNLAHFVRRHAALFAAGDLIPKSRGRTCNAAFGLAALRPRANGIQRKASWKGWAWDYGSYTSLDLEILARMRRTQKRPAHLYSHPPDHLSYAEWAATLQREQPLQWQKYLDQKAAIARRFQQARRQQQEFAVLNRLTQSI